MLDLTALPRFYLETYGKEKVAEVTGQSASVLLMWEKRKRFPLDAVQRLLDFDPSPLNAIKPLYTNPEPGKKLAFLVPLSGKPEPKMMDSLVRLYDSHTMFYRRVAFNAIHVSRNALAAEFLRSEAEWAWWMDGDSLCPAGDAAWFKREAGLPDMPDQFAGLHSIYRMLYHKKTIVSCCYVGRYDKAPPQFGGGDDPTMRGLVRQGPQNRLIEVPWCGFGGVLTHRKVFEDIIATQGNEIRVKPGYITKRFNYEYAFFHPESPETPGDDLPMAKRAVRAGHKIYVDLAIMAAHIGDRAYTHKDT